MNTDPHSCLCCTVVVDEQLRRLLGQYTTARDTLVGDEAFEAGCAPDRLWHARDDAAIAVAEALAQQLPAAAPGAPDGSGA